MCLDHMTTKQPVRSVRVRRRGLRVPHPFCRHKCVKNVADALLNLPDRRPKGLTAIMAADNQQHQSQTQLDNERRGPMTHDPSQSYSHTRLIKSIISLAVFNGFENRSNSPGTSQALGEAMEDSTLSLQIPQDVPQPSTTTSFSKPFTRVSIGGCTRTAGRICFRVTGAVDMRKQLPEQDSPEEYCEIQAFDSLPHRAQANSCRHCHKAEQHSNLQTSWDFLLVKANNHLLTSCHLH
ncbi:hypothetical protein DPX16_19540 [Anabarilius grahami]|uniref:Uncharacterized protein n=1 Tax=Anabarilius grahami TaxID=495550 RepID=A0A3N0Y7B0_ANAGA|nr:hypothetical protein DPX16_19540 [Anabarilius grahami]